MAKLKQLACVVVHIAAVLEKLVSISGHRQAFQQCVVRTGLAGVFAESLFQIMVRVQSVAM